jgi:hypothetical protein
VGAPNLHVAPSLAVTVANSGKDTGPTHSFVRSGLRLAAGLRRDISGYPYDFHAPLHGLCEEESEKVRAWFTSSGGAPVVFDGIHEGIDGEYLDARAVRRLASGQ